MEPSGSSSSPLLPQPSINNDVNFIEDPSSSLWDWNDLLDLAVDLPLSLDSSVNTNGNDNDQPSLPPQPEEIPHSETSDRIRKRDPRLTCSNFLAGIVPCACPELDAQLAEEEAALPGKKRVRVNNRAGSGTVLRCQVPGCEVDITALKGYHKRHRVCLQCAHASTVSLDGECKRYCQQCGKFHLLSDFDEGRRSCRRKLEKHNRRRRKPTSSADKGEHLESQNEDPTCGGEEGRDTLCFSTDIADEEPLMDSEALIESEDGHVSFLNSTPKPSSNNSVSALTFTASGDTQIDGSDERDDYKHSLSPSLGENKSAYSSVCPTGRISFKLYDWNPAEFPRRLRLQIFQWLANMPVELEGYIRPGCTILTLFIAMPTFMWEKLSKKSVTYIEDFVVAPGRILSGRGCVIIYLNNTRFHVMEGMGLRKTSVMKVGTKFQAPRLHYVYPTCFEAGKSIEFIACGSNLFQPKFRFLVSFAGKYLTSDCRIESPCGQIEGHSSVDHQIYKIYIPSSETNIFGPAFVEVENESGLSNFIPVLIGDKETCSEMKTMQQKFAVDISAELSLATTSSSITDSCKMATVRQQISSELLLDVAWLLKDHTQEDLEKIVITSQIQRFNHLLSFLLLNKSLVVLEKVLVNMMAIINKMGLSSVIDGTGDGDMILLKKNMDYAREIVYQKVENSEDYRLCLKTEDNYDSRCRFFDDVTSVVRIFDQDTKMRGAKSSLTSINRSERVPLLDGENVNATNGWPRQSYGHMFSRTSILISRPSIFVIGTAAICFGMCAVFLHPEKVSEFAVTVRRCLTNFR
ncbi:hypothetical protein ACFE04_015174 [Oxalis oulophora]